MKNKWEYKKFLVIYSRIKKKEERKKKKEKKRGKGKEYNVI